MGLYGRGADGCARRCGVGRQPHHGDRLWNGGEVQHSLAPLVGGAGNVDSALGELLDRREVTLADLVRKQRGVDTEQRARVHRELGVTSLHRVNYGTNASLPSGMPDRPQARAAPT